MDYKEYKHPLNDYSRKSSIEDTWSGDDGPDDSIFTVSFYSYDSTYSDWSVFQGIICVGSNEPWTNDFNLVEDIYDFKDDTRFFTCESLSEALILVARLLEGEV